MACRQVFPMYRMTWLKQKIKGLGLQRRGHGVIYTSVPVLQQAIKNELKTANCLLGYRAMWRLLQTKYHFIMKRNTVMMLMKLLDPEGVCMRRKRSLKRFSRKILLMEVTSTNNNPAAILLYYLKAIVRCKENSCLAYCQMAPRDGHSDDFSGRRGFRYGPSTSNTRIECQWSKLRNSVTDWWIDLFKALSGLCVLPSIEKGHKCEQWNIHRIRQNRKAGCPAGVPNDLNELPQLEGVEDYRHSLDLPLVKYCFSTLARRPNHFYPDEFKETADFILNRDFNIAQDCITVENAEQIIISTPITSIHCIDVITGSLATIIE